MQFLSDFEILARQPWVHLFFWALVIAGLCWVLQAVLVRYTKRNAASNSTTGLILKSTRSVIGWVLLLFALALLWQAAPDELACIGSVRRINNLLLIVSIAVLASRAVTGLGEAIIRRHPYDIVDNYRARGILTQTRVLTRTLSSVIVVLGVAAGLMVFPSVREVGTGLLASAGVLGLAVGLAAKPIFGNLLAGLQIAFTQPMRLDDVVIVEGEWGRIEEITRSYVVIKIWDERRLIVPLQYFIEHPFQNWTRGSADILGTVFLWVDYGLPVDPLRAQLHKLCEADPDWDQRVAIIQVTETSERGMQLRVLLSSKDSPRNFDLRCRVREGLIEFIQAKYPQFFVQGRSEVSGELKVYGDAAPRPLK